LRAYAARDARLRVLTQQNKFAGVARNLGIEHAQGDYFMFLDADDLFEPRLIERLYTACEQNNTQMALCRSDIFDMTSGKFAKNNPLPRALFPKTAVFSPRDYADYLFQFVTPVPWAKIFRRDLIIEGGIRFEARRNTNDLYFSFCNAAIARSIAYVDEVLVHLRRGHTGNIQSQNHKNAYECSGALQSVRAELLARGLQETFRRSFVNSVVMQSQYVLKQLPGNPDIYMEFLGALRSRIFAELDALGHAPKFYHSALEYCLLQWMLSPLADLPLMGKLTKAKFFMKTSIRNFGLFGSARAAWLFVEKKWLD
jgi:glycosyltransferase involved in cell wall biosynthesis